MTRFFLTLAAAPLFARCVVDAQWAEDRRVLIEIADGGFFPCERTDDECESHTPTAIEALKGILNLMCWGRAIIISYEETTTTTTTSSTTSFLLI